LARRGESERAKVPAGGPFVRCVPCGLGVHFLAVRAAARAGGPDHACVDGRPGYCYAWDPRPAAPAKVEQPAAGE
jgi:hypothetical protein